MDFGGGGALGAVGLIWAVLWLFLGREGTVDEIEVKVAKSTFQLTVSTPTSVRLSLTVVLILDSLLFQLHSVGKTYLS